MDIKAFYDPVTFTLTYLVCDPLTHDAVIIDPVLDFDPASGKISTGSLEKVIEFVRSMDLRVHYIIETHAHADHLSGAYELVSRHLPEAQIAICERITVVQETFKAFFNLPKSFKTDGSQFHRLLKDHEEIQAGSLRFRVIFTPGHTPACASFLFGDALFNGDALFIPF